MIDFELFGGFDDWQTDKRMYICTSRVTFATDLPVFCRVLHSSVGDLSKPMEDVLIDVL